MASRKFFSSRSSYVYPVSSEDTTSSDNNNQFEFDESEVWTIGSDHPATESRKPKPGSRSSKKVLAGGKKASRPAPASLPVSVPDWSKILKDEYSGNRKRDSDDDVTGEDSDGNGDVDDRIPPHEYLARVRGASLSVHEGIGRTLKGRDLRRVRNGIWKIVGFED